MVSRKNLLEKIRKIEEKQEHHSIRKFTMGAASVLVGLTFMGSNTRPVRASKTKRSEDETVLIETQGTESQATEQSVIEQYTNSRSNNSGQTQTRNNNVNQSGEPQIQNNNVNQSGEPQIQDNNVNQSVQPQAQDNNVNQSVQPQAQDNNVNQSVQPQAQDNNSSSTTETKTPTYQDSVDKVNDINSNINNDLKDVVDKADEVEGVDVKTETPNKVTTNTTDIDKNKAEIEEKNKAQIAEIEKQLADYKAKLDQYKNDLEKYNTELAKYNALRDEYIAKLKEKGLWKEGDVDPSDISQDLVLRKEEHAIVDVVISDNHASNINKVENTKGILTDENGATLLMHQYLVKDSISGDFLTVIYTNLENSKYNGEDISKIEVIYSDLVKSGNKNASIYFGKSPTDGFFYLNSTGVTIELKMYDKDGKLITLKDNTAYVTVGSLNSNVGKQDKYVEKAEIINGNGHKGEGIALPESSIGVHKGQGQYGGDILYADKNNELLYDYEITDEERKLAIEIWGEDIVNKYLGWDDSKDRTKDIFGSGLFKVSGNGIKIRFSNELGSAWATFSTTIPKLAFEGEKPTEPTKPEGITITWQPSELVLKDNGSVHIHYVDVHKEYNDGERNFDPENHSHGFELTDQKQSIDHLSVDDLYSNELWDWKGSNYILATEESSIHDGAKSGVIQSGEKHYYIYLRRATEEITRDKKVTQVIHYVYKDSGETAAPDYVRNEENGRYLVFTQKGKRDKVTGEETWDGEWTLKQVFEAVVSPTIEGYTADRLEVGPYDITVTNDNYGDNLDKNDTVYYVADPAQPTNPTDQPTDPSNPTNPTTPDQPMVPDTPTNPTTPTQPTLPENPTVPEENETVTPLPEETPGETETVIPHPEKTPSEDKKEDTVTPKSQETKHDNTETNTVTPKSEKEETVKNVSTTQTNNVEDAKQVKTNQESTLPETGSKETEKAGAVGLIAAAIGSLLGLSGAEKRKKK